MQKAVIQAAVAGVSDAFQRDYAERVYAGVLGKIIGVYLGRPIENWSHQRILDELGEVDYYVHQTRGRPLVVTDDDISGTFTFVRALADNAFDPNISSQRIGEGWLNYIIENTTILWWGGLGNSTEHTAFLRLKSGICAPQSGSKEVNGRVVSEQIGAQIFIEGWAMLHPGDPQAAAHLAKRAASVSHDGEAVYAAQVVAALTAAAFTENDIDTLLDTAVALIPQASSIAQVITDLRHWHAQTDDYQQNRDRLEEKYGYHHFQGVVPVVPNHGLIILGLLHGGGDFHRSMTIVNSCGWDTDCNSGNLGCILGVRGGLVGLESGPDWRGPVADRLYLPAADPGRSISDAVLETNALVQCAHKMRSLEYELPKEGARFSFAYPGSVQGFLVDEASHDRLSLGNEAGALDLRFSKLARGACARVWTATFIPPELANYKTGYVLVASPTLNPGQIVKADLELLEANREVSCRVILSYYNKDDELSEVDGPVVKLLPGQNESIRWPIPDVGGFPIARIGFELQSERRAAGILRVDRVDWSGVPEMAMRPTEGTMWGRAWAKAIDRFEYQRDGFQHLAQNAGIGMLIQGCREWDDYVFEAEIEPYLIKRCGIGVRVQGLRRYFALLLAENGRLQLIKREHEEEVLAESAYPWECYKRYRLSLEVKGDRLVARVGDETVFDVQASGLEGGAVALICEEGSIGARDLSIRPA